MRASHVEVWARSIVKRAEDEAKVEDDRVELKSIWLDEHKMARHVAAHANAARGEPVLWILGVNEKSFKVVGVPGKEMSDWYPQFEKCFESGIAPACVSHPNLDVDGKNVVALLFETDRAPYVVKTKTDPNCACEGVPQYEVTFRRTNRTLTARREDLLRILAPAVAIPECEILGGTGGEGAEGGKRTFSVSVELYVTAHSGHTIVIRRHRCSAYLARFAEDDNRIKLMVTSLSLPTTKPAPSKREELGEVMITGGSLVRVRLELDPEAASVPIEDFIVGLSLDVAFADRSIDLRMRFKPLEAEIGKLPEWRCIP